LDGAQGRAGCQESRAAVWNDALVNFGEAKIAYILLKVFTVSGGGTLVRSAHGIHDEEQDIRDEELDAQDEEGNAREEKAI
jgi:hypothetical protein